MMVDTLNNQIFYLMWQNPDHSGNPITSATAKKLAENYDKLGLNKSGDDWKPRKEKNNETGP